jgi:hypothetical protein
VDTWSDISEEGIGKVKAFPNPIQDLFYLEMPDAGNVYIVDINGKVVYNQLLEKGIKTIDSSDFDKGMYILTIVTGGQVQTIKLTK